jgi:hypothetical protein
MAIAMIQRISTTTGHIHSSSSVSWKRAKILRICGLKTVADLQGTDQTSVETTVDQEATIENKMNYYFIYDLGNYNLHTKISKNIRLLYKNQDDFCMEEVRPEQFEMPGANYMSKESQVWFLGKVLCELSYIFKNKDNVKNGDTFVYDTKNIILDQAVDLLCIDNNIVVKKIDYRFYQEKFKDYL